MTQLDDLQAYVNLEIPRRRTLLTVAITGYDGNPNDVAAPAILQGAPVGSWYLRETILELYEKLTSGSTTWTKASIERAITLEDLSIAVDYASAVDPLPGVVFSTQQDVDDALAGASGFKHLNAVFEALPVSLHQIDITLAAGVHRPRAGDAIAWAFTKAILPGGSLSISGPVNSTWPVVVASASITGLQLASGDPYLDFAASTFPNDGSLKGSFVRLSTGQLSVIHNHTDSRLSLTASLSPDPTGGTAEVVVPATELRNSLDDVSPSSGGGVLKFDHGSMSFADQSTLSDVIVDGFSSNSSNFMLANSIHSYFRCQLKLGNGNALDAQSGFLLMFDCSVLGDPPLSGTSSTDRMMNIDRSRSFFSKCYFLGGEDGCRAVSGSTFSTSSSVFDEVGSLSAGKPWLEISGLSNFVGSDLGASKTNEVRSVDVGIVASNCFVGGGTSLGLIFSDCSGNAVELQGDVVMDIGPPGAGMSDGGGNLGLGIEVTGLRNTVTPGAATDITGSLGDISVDGVVGTYAEITRVSTLVTKTLHIINNPISSGVGNLPPGLSINGFTVYPSFRYKLGDADAVDLGPWTYGSALPIEPGTLPTFNQGNPYSGTDDDSTLFNAGAYYRAATSTSGDVLLGDLVFESLVTMTSSLGWIVAKTNGVGLSVGYGAITVSGKVRFFLDDGVTTKNIDTAILSAGSWYHLMLFVDRSGSAQWYVDGVASGAAVDISSQTANSYSNAFRMAVGANSVGGLPYDEKISYMSMWQLPSWLDTHLQATVAAERFGNLTGP